jgi:hypothetical protein
MQHGAFALRHQLEIMGCEEDGGAQAVQFHEEMKQSLGQNRIDISGGLVGKQQFRF